jgi:hypothetical protein
VDLSFARSAGIVAPLTMTYPQFLSRCKDIFAVFEGFKPAPLRALLMKLGLTVSKGFSDRVKLIEESFAADP